MEKEVKVIKLPLMGTPHNGNKYIPGRPKWVPKKMKRISRNKIKQAQRNWFNSLSESEKRTYLEAKKLDNPTKL